MNIRGYHKDCIAATLAETAQGASDKARRRVDIRDVGRRSGLESMQARNCRESSRGQAAARRLRVRNQVIPSIIGSAIMLFILVFILPTATPAKTSLQTTGSRAQNAYLAMLPKSTAPRPASASVCIVGAVLLTVADADQEAAFFTNVLSFEKTSGIEVAGNDDEHLEDRYA